MALLHRQREERSSLTPRQIVLLVAYSMTLIMLTNLTSTLLSANNHTSMNDMDSYGFSPLTAVSTATASKGSDTKRGSKDTTELSVCPATEALFPEGSLRPAIEEARQYHLQGGNLKALQLMLDDQLNPTYQRQQIRFAALAENEKILGDQHAEAQAKLENDDIVGYLRQYWSALSSQRGGYAENYMPGHFRPRWKFWEKRYIEVQEPWSYDRWNVSVGPIGPNCSNLVKFGQYVAPSYDVKWFCMPENAGNKLDSDGGNGNSAASIAIEGNSTSVATNGGEESCHIFSIGSNDQWTFESNIIKEMPHCTIHTFDCTLNGGKPKHKPSDDRLIFYDYCIGDENLDASDGKRYRTYSEFVRIAGVPSHPKLLKMDVEGFEYDVFTSMVRSDGDTLPEQIIVELHWASKMTNLPWVLRTRQTGELAILFSMLFSSGYLPVFTFFSKYCAPCLEVLFVRVLC